MPDNRFDTVAADLELPLFNIGDQVRVADRSPIGHYRVPTYLRGKRAIVEAIVTPTAVDNEEEGFGRNAGLKRHYYRVTLKMSEVWPRYEGPQRDSLQIEVFETWLTRISP